MTIQVKTFRSRISQNNNTRQFNAIALKMWEAIIP